MATYKVPQDVEAEDKLLGPLTFKQFIFMLIAAGAALMMWFMYQVAPLMALIPAPVLIIFGGLAVLRREDQPIETYLLSYFNYLVRPRQRVWNTEGYYEHLIITAPKKKADPNLKSDVNQVKGQLEHLANVVDTRGWASKRPDLIQPGSSASTAVMPVDDDRLFIPETQTSNNGLGFVDEGEDFMDDTNPEAQAIDSLLQEQSRQYREETLKKAMESASKQADSTQFGKVVQPPKQTQEASVKTAPEKTPAAIQAEGNNNGENSEPDSKQPKMPVEKPVQELTSNKEVAEDIPPKLKADIMDLSEMKISSIAAKVNKDKADDNSIQEGQEVKLR